MYFIQRVESALEMDLPRVLNRIKFSRVVGETILLANEIGFEMFARNFEPPPEDVNDCNRLSLAVGCRAFASQLRGDFIVSM